jgi:hypothetical protein
MAAILVMGTVPKIFQTSDKIDQALVQQHEDEARANQTLHEDLEREKQKSFENEQRDKQRDLIVKETNKSMNDLEQRLVKFMNQSTNRSLAGSLERRVLLDNILNVSQQHDKVAKDHNILQTKVENTTKQTYDLLKTADERNFEATMNNNNLIDNLTQTVEEIKQMHTSIMKTLKIVTKKLD